VSVLGSTLRSGGADVESVIDSVGEQRRGWKKGRSRRRTEDSKSGGMVAALLKQRNAPIANTKAQRNNERSQQPQKPLRYSMQKKA